MAVRGAESPCPDLEAHGNQAVPETIGVAGGHDSPTPSPEASPSPAEDEEEPRRPRRSGVREATRRLVRDAMSSWRWPENPGEMPLYIQRQFRLKTFCLIGFQQLVVLGIMVVVETSVQLGRWTLGNSPVSAFLFYFLGLLSLIILFLLFCMRDKYPTNYMILGLLTLVTGIFWGLTRLVWVTDLHFETASILCLTMFLAAFVSTLLSFQKVTPLHQLALSIGIGWAVSSMLALSFGPRFGINFMTILSGIGISIGLLIIMLLDVGKLILTGNPDDFMRVVIAMNSAVLVVVSVPFFILAVCFFYTSAGIIEAPEANGLDLPRQAPETREAAGRQ